MINQILDKENYTKNKKTFAEVLVKDRKENTKINSKKKKE